MNSKKIEKIPLKPVAKPPMDKKTLEEMILRIQKLVLKDPKKIAAILKDIIKKS